MLTASSCVLGVESRHLKHVVLSFTRDLLIVDFCMRDDRFSLHYEVSMFSAHLSEWG